jgi:predicted amidophosphoribosyltransferase
MNKVLGWLEILLGSLSIWYAIWGHRRHGRVNRRDMMCPGCQRVFPGPQAPSECPECRLPLEPIKGFYKRHPELKREDEHQEAGPKK